MAGGLLNIVSIGSANLFLTGNPTKTFFSATYAKYTNFGLQKFRLDFEGVRDLRSTDESTFTFKMKRYGDLLMDTYLVMTLPDIYSPIYNPSPETGNVWSPYEFRWIRNIGTQLIKRVEIFCGSQKLQSYSGHYLESMISRDFDEAKKKLVDAMSGNIRDLFDPANAEGRINTYPNAYCSPDSSTSNTSSTSSTSGAFSAQQQQPATEPSIRGRMLYIPLNTWFCLNTKCAFPLVATPFAELSIQITLRPIQELFQIRDVCDPNNAFPFIQPDFNIEYCKMYRFLQSPPHDTTNYANYTNFTCTWNADIHLVSTYAFLSDAERKLFAAESQMYLVKDIFEQTELNVVGTKRIEISHTNGMVANWMILLQRNDVNMRNEWSNYSNWAYSDTKPQNVMFPGQPLPTIQVSTMYPTSMAPIPGGQLTPEYGGMEGLYCYNFGLHTNPFEIQPSGAINMSRFRSVELEIATCIPPFNMGSGINTAFSCIEVDGAAVSVTNKPAWTLYEYGYNVRIIEERYNLLLISNGQAQMTYSR